MRDLVAHSARWCVARRSLVGARQVARLRREPVVQYARAANPVNPMCSAVSQVVAGHQKRPIVTIRQGQFSEVVDKDLPWRSTAAVADSKWRAVPSASGELPKFERWP